MLGHMLAWEDTAPAHQHRLSHTVPEGHPGDKHRARGQVIAGVTPWAASIAVSLVQEFGSVVSGTRL